MPHHTLPQYRTSRRKMPPCSTSVPDIAYWRRRQISAHAMSVGHRIGAASGVGKEQQTLCEYGTWRRRYEGTSPRRAAPRGTGARASAAPFAEEEEGAGARMREGEREGEREREGG
eukprot:3109793-Rhodomonas_salina.2